MQNLLDRVPPQDLEAERSVLGACLLKNDVIDDVSIIISAKHFYSSAHHQIWCALVDMHSAGLEADAVTVTAELTRRKQLADIGGPAAIMQILETVPHAAHAEHYARIVREKWLRRKLTDHGVAAIETAHDEIDINEGVRHCETELFSLIERGDDHQVVRAADVVQETFDAIFQRMETKGEIVGVPSGFQNLDTMTCGFDAELVILAGRPSMGKSAIACNMAVTMAQAETPVLFVSLEQKRSELVERMICGLAGIDSRELRKGNISETENLRISQAVDQIKKLPIYIDDSVQGAPIVSIAAQARRMRRKHKVGAMFIDYLQLIEPAQSVKAQYQNRERDVADTTRRLKFIANELEIPVITLAQLNRGVEDRQDKRPRLSDLRESGAIEQDADVVLFVHRPEAYDPDLFEDKEQWHNKGLCELILAKRRNGMTGTARLRFHKEQMRFVDMPPKDLQEAGAAQGAF